MTEICHKIEARRVTIAFVYITRVCILLIYVSACSKKESYNALIAKSGGWIEIAKVSRELMKENHNKLSEPSDIIVIPIEDWPPEVRNLSPIRVAVTLKYVDYYLAGGHNAGKLIRVGSEDGAIFYAQIWTDNGSKSVWESDLE